MESAWPLTGRAEEHAAIKRVLAGTGEYAGVVLAGDAGVGKSRLAREVLAALSVRAEVRWVAATASGSGLPLGAFAEWIGGGGSDPAVLVRSVIDSLTATTPGRPVVVAVDDAHLLDDLSAVVVHQLVHRRLAKVAVTVRSRETPPDAITALWKDSYLQRVEVGPLSREASDRLLAAVLGGPVDSHAAQRLWQLTQGNVLFLRHLVEQELAGGRLFNESGRWSWRDEELAFTTLGELLDAQMGALSDPVGEAVDLLAVGEPLDREVLAGIVGSPAIDAASEKGLVTLAHDDQRSTIRLAHPLYGELRRARAGGARLRRLRGRLVRALADVPAVDAHDLIHRAVLLLDSDLPPDPAMFTQAAGAAMQQLNPVLAERLARVAREIDPTYEAVVLQHFALHQVGRVSESDEVIANTSRRKLTAEQQSNLAMFRAGNLFFGLGLAGAAMRVLEEAEGRIPYSANGAVRAFRAAMEAANGSAQVAVDAARAELTSATSDAAKMVAYFALMVALGHAGHVNQVNEVAKHGYQLAERAFDVAPLIVPFTLNHILALIFAGHQADAEAIAQRWVRQTADLPGASAAIAAGFMGMTELSAGRASSARQWVESTVRNFVAVEGVKHGVIDAQTDLVVALAAGGDFPGAARELSALDASGKPFGFLESRCALAAAWVRAAEGAMSEAAALARGAAETARDRGHSAQEVMCLQTATRFGDTTTAARLAELGDAVEGPRVLAASAHAAALAADDARGLVAASEQFERMGDVLTAADVAAQAAAAYRARDRRGSALSAQERAERLADRCGPVDTPALRALRASPLTARQQEILALAAQGMSNKQIAERLNVSVRTVEGHRYRAGKK